jgi:hypothetical protein
MLVEVGCELNSVLSHIMNTALLHGIRVYSMCSQRNIVTAVVLVASLSSFVMNGFFGLGAEAVEGCGSRGGRSVSARRINGGVLNGAGQYA